MKKKDYKKYTKELEKESFSLYKKISKLEKKVEIQKEINNIAVGENYYFAEELDNRELECLSLREKVDELTDFLKTN